MTFETMAPAPAQPAGQAPAGVRFFALVPCAGVGVRAGAGGPKQYARLAGQAVVGHTLAALARVIRLHATLVVLAPDDGLFEGLVPGHAGWVARCGGATRAASVLAGLQALRARGASDDDWVLVHDAARCLVQPAWVDRLIDACLHDDVGGLLAVPLADTLKEERPAQSGRAAATLPRAGKWAAQTPQMFRLGLLQRALLAAGEAVTDESSAVEHLGLAPLLVPGELENLKLTWPADFALAQRLLQTRADPPPSAFPSHLQTPGAQRHDPA
jgi:2-C-methyl-D-erythritol 4-phosphate cytidylyltransferase